MLSLQQMIIPGIIIILIIIFGPDWFDKTYRKWKSAGSSMKKIDREFEEEAKNINESAKKMTKDINGKKENTNPKD